MVPPQPCFWETGVLCAEMERTREGTALGGGLDFAKFEGVLLLAHTELSGECGTHTRVLSLRWTCGYYQFVDATWSQRLDEKNKRRDQVVTEEGPAQCPKQLEKAGGRVRPSNWSSGELKVCRAVAIWGFLHAFPLTRAGISTFIFIFLCNCFEEAGGGDSPSIQSTLRECWGLAAC